jgi:FeS assembly SUF system regulator
LASNQYQEVLVLKISKLADYATVVASYLAQIFHDEIIVSASEVAQQVHIAAPSVSIVLKLLLAANLVISTRGAVGGYRLARSPGNINLAEIIVAIDGDFGLTDCSSGKDCQHTEICSLKDNWMMINQVVYQALQSVSLLAMQKPIDQHSLMFKGIKVKVVADE